MNLSQGSTPPPRAISSGCGVDPPAAPMPVHIPVLDALRDRMRQKGKARKIILIAVARQLLVILNAMLKTGTPIALA